MNSRHVLTVNQVLEIMLRWLELRDWEKALISVIPKRKLPDLQKHNATGDEYPNENEEASEAIDGRSKSSNPANDELDRRKGDKII